MHYATKGGHENIVALLINNGADINIGDKVGLSKCIRCINQYLF